VGSVWKNRRKDDYVQCKSRRLLETSSLLGEAVKKFDALRAMQTVIEIKLMAEFAQSACLSDAKRQNM